MSWSAARIVSTATPSVRRMAIERSASPWVWDSSGDRLRVQLTYTAERSEKSHRLSAHSSRVLSSICSIRSGLLNSDADGVVAGRPVGSGRGDVGGLGLAVAGRGPHPEPVGAGCGRPAEEPLAPGAAAQLLGQLGIEPGFVVDLHLHPGDPPVWCPGD